jgi:hypothetical protein
MAEENYDIDSTNLDDVSVLRELLHSIHGLSPVSSTDFLAVPVEADDQSGISFDGSGLIDSAA